MAILVSGIVTDLTLLSHITSRGIRWTFFTRRTAARSLAWTDLGLLFSSFALIMSALLLSADYLTEETRESALFLLPQMASLPMVALCAIAFILKRRRLNLRQAFGIKKKSIMRNLKQGAICYLAIMPFVMIASLIYMQLLARLGVDIGHQPVIEMLVDPLRPTWIQFTIVLLAVLSAPVIEELIFRGIMLPMALKKMDPLLAIFLVSTLFAAVHTHLPALVPILVLAAGLSAGYIVTGSIIVPMVAHGIFNTVSIAVLLLMKDSIM